jgi:hypothetical protein
MARRPAAEVNDDTITELTRPEGPPLGAHHKHGWRDTLLPKLISGELRVKDAKRFVDGAGSMDEVDSGRA